MATTNAKGFGGGREGLLAATQVCVPAVVGVRP